MVETKTIHVSKATMDSLKKSSTAIAYKPFDDGSVGEFRLNEDCIAVCSETGERIACYISYECHTKGEGRVYTLKVDLERSL